MRFEQGGIKCQMHSTNACHRTETHYIESMIIRPSPAHIAQQLEAPSISHARFGIGEVVRHKHFPFRGVVFDIDPVFANSEEWYEAIPEEIRPTKEQPYYHLLAENAESNYVAYVSQQNLESDEEDGPVYHPAIAEMFQGFADGRYMLKPQLRQ